MFAAIEQITGLNWKRQGAAFLVAGGHGATHEGGVDLHWLAEDEDLAALQRAERLWATRGVRSESSERMRRSSTRV